MSTSGQQVAADKHEPDHLGEEHVEEALEEELALLEATDTRSGTGIQADGDATYRHETWGFISEALYSRLNRASVISSVELRRQVANLYNPDYIVPIFGNQLLWRYFSILGPITQMGKHGSLALAGGALANTTIAIVVVVPSLSASSALDTLATQAHGGSKYSTIKDLNRLYSLRVYLVMWIVIAVLLPITCLFEPIFRLLQVETEVAHMAARFMQHSAFGMPGLYTYECIRKYCQAQGRMVGPAVAIALAAIPTLPILFSDAFGLYTPAIALGFFWNATAIFAGLYMYYFLPKSAFEDLPTFKTVSQDLGIVIRLTLAGFIAIGSDFFAWEFLNFASAWMGNDVLAANSVFLSTANFFFSLPSALMNASATRVGNYLGSNQPLNAKTAAYTSLLMGNAVAASSAIAVALNSKTWTGLFTSDPVVTAIVQRSMPFFCFIAFMDAIQGIGGGILRGAGMPMEIAHAMALCHYTVGLPLSVLFAFAFHGGLFGLWGGFGVGLCLVCARLAYLVIYNDWHASARKAQAHLQASDGRSISTQMTHVV